MRILFLGISMMGTFVNTYTYGVSLGLSQLNHEATEVHNPNLRCLFHYSMGIILPSTLYPALTASKITQELLHIPEVITFQDQSAL